MSTSIVCDYNLYRMNQQGNEVELITKDYIRFQSVSTSRLLILLTISLQLFKVAIGCIDTCRGQGRIESLNIFRDLFLRGNGNL